MQGIFFRRMEEKDIGRVADMERTLFSRPWSAQAFSEALRQDSLFVTAVDGEEAVGYCGMYCSYGEGEITNVAVAPRLQGRGIGRKMMEYLIGQARLEGMGRLILEARVSNVRAIRLYESLGFRNCGIRKDFYELPREDGMVMELWLG